MTLHVYTARLTYSGPDRLDITRANVDRARKAGKPVPFGAAFAPSWEILKPALEARKEAKALMDECLRLQKQEGASDLPTFDPWTYVRAAEVIEAAAFEIYAPKLLEEMRALCYAARARTLRCATGCCFGARSCPRLARWTAVR